MKIKKFSEINESLSEPERAEEYKNLIKEVSDYILVKASELNVAPETHDLAKSLIDIAEMFGGIDDFRNKLSEIDRND